MSRPLRPLLLALCALVAAGPAAGQEREPRAQAEAAAQPFRLGLVPRGPAAAHLEALDLFRRGLEAALFRRVRLVALPSLNALVEAHAGGRIDGAFYPTAAYAAAQARCGCLEPLVAPAAGDGATSYRAVMVARRDSGLAGPADLEGGIVAVGPADSLAARIVPLAGLKAEGLDLAALARLVEAGSAADAVRMALDGAADAAFAWSSQEGDPTQSRSRGTLAFLVERGELDAGEIAVLWRSAPIFHGPFAVLSSVPASEREALKAHLVGLADSDPASYDLLDLHYGGGFRPVEASDYEAVAEALKADVGSVAEGGRAPSGPPLPRPAPPGLPDSGL